MTTSLFHSSIISVSYEHCNLLQTDDPLLLQMDHEQLLHCVYWFAFVVSTCALVWTPSSTSPMILVGSNWLNSLINCKFSACLGLVGESFCISSCIRHCRSSSSSFLRRLLLEDLLPCLDVSLTPSNSSVAAFILCRT